MKEPHVNWLLLYKYRIQIKCTYQKIQFSSYNILCYLLLLISPNQRYFALRVCEIMYLCGCKISWFSYIYITGQPRGITKMAFVDKWPLFGASETTYPIFTGHIKTGLCRQETTIRRCCYVQGWLHVIRMFNIGMWITGVHFQYGYIELKTKIVVFRTHS